MQVTMRSLRVRTLSAGICVLLGAVGAQNASADEVASAQTVKSVWRVQEIYFSYFGLTTNYSCDSLRVRMRDFLLQVGAREDVVVSAGGCIDQNRPEKYPSVRIFMAYPVSATPENLQAIAQDPKRQETEAKLARKSKQPVGSGEQFEAVRSKVVLNSKELASVGPSGDCELVDQMRRSIFSKMDVKVLNDRMKCTPYQGSVSNQTLELEVLSAVPVKS